MAVKTAPPLRLLDGTLIDVITGEVVSDPTVAVEADTSSEDSDQSVETGPVPLVTRKRVAELPDSPDVMNVIMIILGYSLWGLPASEIAHAMNTQTAKVEQLQLSDAYQTAMKEVTANLIESMQSDVRGKLAAHAAAAVDTMIKMLKSKSESNRQTVAADILDRAGFSPQAIVSHKHSFEDELVMRVIRDDKTAMNGLPQVDMKVING